MAAYDHRSRMVPPTTCASPKRRHRHPHEAPLPSASDADHDRVVRALAGGDVRGSCCGVLLATHPGLGFVHRRPAGPDCRPVAPTNASSRRDHGMGRADPAPAGLQPIRPRPRVIRVPRQCCPCWAPRSCWPPAAPYRRWDAAASWPGRRCGRSAGCLTRGTCGTGRSWCSLRQWWATRWGWSAGWRWSLSGVVGVLTLRFLENPLRYAPSAAPLSPGQYRGWRNRHRSCGLCRCGNPGTDTQLGRPRRTTCTHGDRRHASPEGRQRRGLRHRDKAAVRASANRAQRIGWAQSRPVKPDTLARRHACREKRAVVQRLPARRLSKAGNPNA